MSRIGRPLGQRPQKIHNIRRRPVRSADELPPDLAIFVDDVGLGKLVGPIQGIRLVGGVTHGEQVDVVVADELFVSALIDIRADRQDDHLIPKYLLHLHQGGHFGHAGRAPGGPKVQNHGFSAKLAQRNGMVGVCNCELRGVLAQLGRAGALVTGRKQDYQQDRDEVLKPVHEFIITK